MTYQKPFRFEWIDYQNSGDQPLYGDHRQVVGYSAIAAYREIVDENILSAGDKKQLMKIAGEAVRSAIVWGKTKPVITKKLNKNLKESAGAFVSIYVSGKLRGCMGSFTGNYSLAETVSRSAFSACNDNRFTPPVEDELDSITIEISALTPLKKVNSIEEIELGRHGIFIRSGLNTGTFLPQVAEKQGWTLEEFLGRCSRDKAGLGWEGWKNAELYTYEATIFTGIANDNR
jgi:AmmeMemoRadiSam system protein A